MVTLKWKGDELFLGATRMGEVMPVWTAKGAPGTQMYQYVLGPDDNVSEPYQSKADARQDCERHVRDLLAKAGA